jgi:hypothetical protein
MNFLKYNISFSIIAEQLLKQKSLKKDSFLNFKGTGPKGLIMKSDVLDFYFKNNINKV